MNSEEIRELENELAMDRTRWRFSMPLDRERHQRLLKRLALLMAERARVAKATAELGYSQPKEEP